MTTTEPLNQRKRQLNDENADPSVIQLDDAEEQEDEEQSSKALNGVLPLSRVKKIIKMAALGESMNVSAAAAKMIQLCAEEYLRAFVRTSQIYAEQSGRKTVQLKDLNRVIKDDWAFALLEDALVDWPNDTEQQKLNFSKIQISEQDSSSLFYKAPRAKHDVVWQTVEPDTVMTNRDMPDDDFNYNDLNEEEENDLQSEFNETDIHFLELDNLNHQQGQKNVKSTPKPTMEYLQPADQNTSECRLAEPLSFEDDDEQDAQRPYNSKFLESRRVDEEEDEEYNELLDDDENDDRTLVERSPIEFDLEDIEDL